MSSSAQGLTEKKAQRMIFTKAVVLLSGGIDSSTTAAIAKHEGYEVYALSFDYNQRHKVELEAAKNIALSLKVKKHLIINFDLREIGGSALTSEMEVPKIEQECRIKKSCIMHRESMNPFISLLLSPSPTFLHATQSSFRLRLHGQKRLRLKIYLSAQMPWITAAILTAVPNI